MLSINFSHVYYILVVQYLSKLSHGLALAASVLATTTSLVASSAPTPAAAAAAPRLDTGEHA